MPSSLKEFKSDFSIINQKIAIVASQFNQHITHLLHKGSTDTLLNRGISFKNIQTYWVPGAFEIPITCKKIFDTNTADGIITLGAVIKGDTPHFDYISDNCAQGILQVSLQYNKPIIFGVLTTNTTMQALERSGLKLGNKGSEASHSLLNLFSMYEKAGFNL